MKLIETFKSPNFNERKAQYRLTYIVLHYTAMTTYQEAIDYYLLSLSMLSASINTFCPFQYVNLPGNKIINLFLSIL